MPTKADRISVPKFATEAVEAHQDMVEADLLAAMSDGTAQHNVARRLAGEAKVRAAAATAPARALLAAVPSQDRDPFHELAVKAGAGDETYTGTSPEGLASVEDGAA